MKITKQEVLYVAHLSRLNIDETSIDKFSEQIGKILEYIDTLNTVDTKDIKETSHAIFLTNAFREDVESPHLNRDASLLNAPQEEDGNFVVPKVIG
ncbi:MAG: Asp-tRNA(Asn)/Glu-tRNA(Gln) amidotransferase subunit GatC [Desulfobacterales bacterium]|nr:Asp-tRNA(Asn)/Glu-tRNA(Gln) amidotransferase subunit GatC [Desulfobacterales bacterium]MBF0396990.1 Asp-tRNA(Asn)/Glu-tRNA(Gln) amidotransferase subunit GatC [Desulfobacterales bacterium]